MAPPGMMVPQEEAPVQPLTQETTDPDQQAMQKDLVDEQVIQTLQDRMDELDDGKKALIVEYLSPELSQIMGLLFDSPKVQAFFDSMSDPNITLVPVPKKDLDTTPTVIPNSKGQLPTNQSQKTQTAPTPSPSMMQMMGKK
jgi:hypothetical protein